MLTNAYDNYTVYNNGITLVQDLSYKSYDQMANILSENFIKPNFRITKNCGPSQKGIMPMSRYGCNPKSNKESDYSGIGCSNYILINKNLNYLK